MRKRGVGNSSGQTSLMQFTWPFARYNMSNTNLHTRTKHITQLSHACNIKLTSIDVFLTAIDAKMDREKSSAIFIKFYNFVYMFFFLFENKNFMVVFLILVPIQLVICLYIFACSPLKRASAREKNLTLY